MGAANAVIGLKQGSNRHDFCLRNFEREREVVKRLERYGDSENAPRYLAPGGLIIMLVP